MDMGFCRYIGPCGADRQAGLQADSLRYTDKNGPISIAEPGTSRKSAVIFVQVKRHVGDHHLPPEQEGQVDEPCRLVVQEMVPPLRRDELR